MLERELREMTHVPRWGIVRTIRQQYLSDHTAMVAVYANDIAVYLGLDYEEIGILLQMALWHDFKEEIFSGDITGPCKRAGMNEDARKEWDDALELMAFRIFERMGDRDGTAQIDHPRWKLFCAIIKLADMLDECCEMGVEMSMGNGNVKPIFTDSLRRVGIAAHVVSREMGWNTHMESEDVPLNPEEYRQDMNLKSLVRTACYDAYSGVSRNNKFEVL